MPVSTPVDIGTSAGGTAGSALTRVFTTTATVPSGAVIFSVAGGWNPSAATTITFSGGSLTWTKITQQDSGTDSFAAFWASAPAGLASGTSLTASYASADDGRPASAFYVTGANALVPINGFGSATTAATATPSSGTFTTTDAAALGFTCFYEDDTVTTSTAPTNYTELQDYQSDVTNNQSVSVNYRNPVPVGANSATNTWAAIKATNIGIGFGVASAPAVNPIQAYGPRRTNNRLGPYNFVENRVSAVPAAAPAVITVKRLPATGVG